MTAACTCESFVAVWDAGTLRRRCAKCGAAPEVVEGEPIETLRDRFAMAALSGMRSGAYGAAVIAEAAYSIADAMLRARVKL